MKYLKIYFAILFFSFLGGANAELMAQNNTCKYGEQLTSLGSDNGNYSVLLTSRKNSDNDFTCVITLFRIFTKGVITVWEQSFTGLPSDKYYIGKGRIYAGDDPRYTVIGGDNGQGTGTFLRLHNDGELAIYGGSWSGDGDKVWSTGTCGGKLGGCGAVGSR